MTNTAPETDPAFHNTSRRPIFQPSERKVLQNFIDSQTLALDAQEKLIEVIKQELADCQLRCDELTAENARLRERHVLNQN